LFILQNLGWICYRTECLTPEQRAAKVKEAEQLLLRSKEIEPNHGRTFYYLGRCYSELPDRAHDAFTHYRQAIDKSEGDADTWCSIGVLYHHQQQDTDALQVDKIRNVKEKNFLGICVRHTIRPGT
jgi:tetratricopeptide (TPR) repeat protein